MRKGQEVSQIFQINEKQEDIKYLIQLQIIEGNVYLGHFAVRPALIGEPSPKNKQCEKL